MIRAMPLDIFADDKRVSAMMLLPPARYASPVPRYQRYDARYFRYAIRFTPLFSLMLPLMMPALALLPDAFYAYARL